MQKIMKNKGITIVALVITIIIMLILAGVTLNIALGENGLFKMAKSAVDKYQESAQNEEKDLDGIVEDLKHIIPEDAGKEVEVPKSEQDKWDLTKVTPIADGKGNTIPVPKGFFYVGGNIDTGFVISSESGDDLNNSKKGNQFVWIPCTANQYEEAKYDVIDKNWTCEDTYKDNGDTGGVPSEATFYSTTAIYNKARGRVEDTGAIKNYRPVSQKGVQVWNYITQPNAKLVAENMYKGDANVGSYLVDSQAWNVICNKFETIIGDGLNEPTKGRGIKDSSYVGNYRNNDKTDYTKITGLWAKYGETKTGMKDAMQYETGPITKEDMIDQTTGRSYIELPTGSSDDFEVYNIYDMAGNFWELTTEHNVIKESTDTEKPEELMLIVERGGCFNNVGGDYPVIRANAGTRLSSYVSAMGFRVVLYVK